jgi:hypothetical protein
LRYEKRNLYYYIPTRRVYIIELWKFVHILYKNQKRVVGLLNYEIDVHILTFPKEGFILLTYASSYAHDAGIKKGVVVLLNYDKGVHIITLLKEEILLLTYICG